MRAALTILITLTTLTVGACDPQLPEATVEQLAEPSACDPDDGLLLFEQQIAPLIKGHEASCQACHLAGTRLSAFVEGKTPCEAIACMEAQGVVDLERPERSLVLDWIRRGLPDDPEAISPAHRELEAFSEWITYSQQCHLQNCGTIKDPCGLPRQEIACSTDDLLECGLDPDEMARGRDLLRSRQLTCTERDMALAFHLLVTPWRNRCAHCHSPGGALADIGEPPPPHWMDHSLLFEADMDGSLRTMRNVLNRGLINPDRPGQSLLLLKPLWESQGGVYHEGGDKFQGPNDKSYRDFLVWAVMVAPCMPLAQDPTLIQ